MAPAGARLQIAAIELGDFPVIGANLIATNSASERLADLQGLRFWENGVPIADFTLEPIAAGIELYLLLDISEEWRESEGDTEPSLVRVRESLLRLAGRYFEAGRDRVWLGATTAQEASWLVEDASEPGQLLDALDMVDVPTAAASNPGDPASLLALALGAADKGSGEPDRFPAIVLFTAGTGLSATRLQPLSQQARALQVPLFVILAGGAAPGETVMETLEAATAPTRGATYQLSDAGRMEALYELLAANALQTQVRYHTNLQGDGDYPVRVALGDVEDSATLRLAFRPPEVEILLDEGSEIRRVGLAPDSAVGDLQPAVQTVSVQLSWPDGIPRRVQGATLLVGGTPQPAPVLGGADALQFDWDIAALDEGEYVLTVEITDTAGLVATSPPRTIAISVARPAPTPTTPPPTATPPATVATRPLPPLVIGIGGAFFLLLGLALLWRARRGLAAKPARRATPADGRPFLALVTGERWNLKDALTIGRQGADVELEGEGVAALHARLVAAEDGYWLYDEGSSSGTYLNGERLGLEGRRVHAGDQIRFGSVVAHFTLER